MYDGMKRVFRTSINDHVSATEVNLRHYHNRPVQTDGQVGGIFPGDLFKREHSDRCSSGGHRKPAIHSRTHPAFCCGIQHGHRFRCSRVFKAGKKQFSSTTCTSCHWSTWMKDMCPKRPPTPTSSRTRVTTVLTVTATSTVESHYSVLLFSLH